MNYGKIYLTDLSNIFGKPVYIFTNILKNLKRNRETYVDWFVLFVFSILLIMVTDRYLMGRIPGWDSFRSDADFVGRLHMFKESLLQGTIPYMIPTYDLGHYFYADPSHYLSPFFPIYWLSTVSSAEVVWFLRFVFMLTLGGIGTYTFMLRFTPSRIYALAVSCFYLFIPTAWTLRYGTAWDSWIYFLPIFLDLTIRLFHKDKSALMLFLVFSFLSNTLNLFIYGILINFYIVSIFSFCYFFFNKKQLLKASLFSMKATSIYILSGAFFYVPLLFYTIESTEYKDFLCQHLNFCPSDLWTFPNYIAFIKSKIWPAILSRRGYDIPMYIPGFLSILGISSIIFARLIGITKETISLFITFLTMIFLLFISPLLIMLTPLNKIFMVRHQYLLITYLWYFLCSIGIYYMFSYISGYYNKIQPLRKLILTGKKISLYTFIFFFLILASVTIYIYLSAPNQHYTLVLMIVTECLIVALFLLPFTISQKSHYLTSRICLLVVALFAVFGQRIYIQCKYGGGGLCFNDFSLKADTYEIQHINKEAFQNYDKSYRRLYLAKDWQNRGRNWQLIGQTALHPLEGVESLFTWNYACHPYVFILRGGLDQRFRVLTNFTAATGSIENSGNLLKLLGVKYIVSAHAPFPENGPSVKYVSHYFKKTSATNLKGYSTQALDAIDNGLSGNFYLYELSNPYKIAYLAESFDVIPRAEIYKRIIYQSLENPNTLLLEESPKIPISSDRYTDKEVVDIVQSTNSLIDINTIAQNEKMLVVTYIFWPLWRAYIDGIPTKIYRAFGGFMSVKVPQGKHIVTFKYIPWDFYLGTAITAFTFLSFFILRRRRKSKGK